jgi:hypothetical protein
MAKQGDGWLSRGMGVAKKGVWVAKKGDVWLRRGMGG